MNSWMFMLFKAVCPILFATCSYAQAAETSACPVDPKQYFDDCIGYYEWADGSKYFGNWEENKRSGYGVWSNRSGDYFVGRYKSDLRVGYGFYFWNDGVIEWCNYEVNGKPSKCKKFPRSEIFTTSEILFKNQPENLRKSVQMRLSEFPVVGGTIDGVWGRRTLVGVIFLYAIHTRNLLAPPDDGGEYVNFAIKQIGSTSKDDAVLEVSSGSGFAVSYDGYVITNNHVIEGCQEVAVHDTGRAVPATVVTYDLQNDLALLKGDFIPKTVLALSDDQPELLQDVYVAGYPFGNEISSSIKVTKGIVSSLTGIGNNFSNIQIDAALQVGNSGGPILDEMGNVVGVAVSKLDAKYMYENFGTIPENTNFGIKSNVVRSVLESSGVSSPSPSTSEITKSDLGAMITGGTYYVSCLMTLAQIQVLRTKKVMFENLD